MAILVVGGAGYIGSHIVRMLRQTGSDVVAFDNLEKGHPEAVGDVSFFRGDLRTKSDIEKAFDTYGIDAVMHFSAYSLVGESMEKPELYYANNVQGTVNLLSVMRERGVKTFIFSSTAAVYGEPVGTPIDEQHPTNPTNVYGETKLVVERMLDWFDRIHGIKSVRLRYFNAAGADPGGDIGELHSPETHLIPLVLSVALGKRECISIFGEDYDTPDGTCIRDYIHVNDLADAHVRALDYLRSEKKSTVFNLGNGSGHSVRRVIDAAREVTGIDIPVKVAGRRPGDPAVLIASSEKAVRELKWEPQLHDISTIIETAWKWHSGKALAWEKHGRPSK